MTAIWDAISVPAFAATSDATIIGASSRMPASATNIPTRR